MNSGLSSKKTIDLGVEIFYGCTTADKLDSIRVHGGSSLLRVLNYYHISI